ncbi:hypothetical protein MIR68_010232 [Amoeboaphelidium protococcarum]|nr:hypothetical protein MIR68_010232 [Amoeboaphelidium protococcarum]
MTADFSSGRQKQPQRGHYDHYHKLPPQHYLDGAFTRECLQLVREIEPTAEEVEQLNGTYLYLYEFLSTLFGRDNILLHKFGSAANGLFLRGSVDMDLCMDLSDVKLIEMEQLRLLKCEQIREEYAQSVREYEQHVATKGTVAVGGGKSGDDGEQKGDSGDVDEEDEEEKVKAPRQQPPPTIPQVILDFIGERLSNAESKRFQDVKVLTKTRIPIIKYRDAVTGINVDLGFQNTLAVYNTRLLHAYSMFDVRLRHLVYLVKYWSKRRSINDTYSGTLSSYAYVLMVIHYLQCGVSPPVLPNLQKLSADGQTPQRLISVKTFGHELVPIEGQNVDVNTTEFHDPTIVDKEWRQVVTDEQYDTYFFENLEAIKIKSLNEQSLGSLFYGFIKYWAFDFDFKEHVASIRLGGILTKADKGWVPLLDQQQQQKESKDKEESVQDGVPSNVNVAKENKEVSEQSKTQQQQQQQSKEQYQRFWVCIEDPFEVGHNLGRPVGRDSLYFIRGELLRASSLLTGARNYSREYLNQVAVLDQNRGAPHFTNLHQHVDSLVPKDLLSQIVAETEYKTREEHKIRNKENMDRKTKREEKDKLRGNQE